ncbi:succinylglutamate desuccinylase aspartoacylase [Seminavis robusta]|uniref:Succinylglutamate desuccinylase aspartoacylase n=1 Tax=Seminavis robusta TaxID=568900 RepID=A0A9N8I005_9STRA|nr:succinylglutamate desuccinylase aspartoacylase [Seminavis robusta]|eukprot:Sro3312_g346620.1 succinylglutamate desuccinylase aspartoacylase (238) ;mRNA; r:3296-4009
MPGAQTSSDSGARLCYSLWNDLYMPSNPDLFFDFCTRLQRGASFPYFIYADRRNHLVDDIMKVMPADIIKDDVGEDGTVETEMLKVGIPAVTMELGSAKEWNRDIKICEVSKESKMQCPTWACGKVKLICLGLRRTVAMLSPTFAPIVVATWKHSWSWNMMSMLAMLWATCTMQAFGGVRETYTAPVAGHVTSLATDPIREPGSMIVRLCYQVEPEADDEVSIANAKALRGIRGGTE